MSQLFGMDNVISSLQGNYNKVNNEVANATNTKNTVGNPKLSETASSYYEELKAKHADVEFVLVSNDKKDIAKEYTSNLVSDKSMIVLISEDEVEQMAIDENLRAKNEKLIDDAKAQMPGLLEELKKSGTEVKSFGMEFNDDGTASYFAVIDKSMTAQKERIEAKQEEKRAEKKANAKEAANNKVTTPLGHTKDLVTVSASSMDDLIKKLQDIAYEAKADSVMTEQEKMVGQSFDFSV
ncbi:MAG: hypothetical protein IJ958_07195 [Agathobacter sp.]|nr:hypothetical protein [Agathobacter sp.]